MKTILLLKATKYYYFEQCCAICQGSSETAQLKLNIFLEKNVLLITGKKSDPQEYYRRVKGFVYGTANTVAHDPIIDYVHFKRALT